MFGWFGVHDPGPTHKRTGRERETRANRGHFLHTTVGAAIPQLLARGPALLTEGAAASPTAVPQPARPPRPVAPHPRGDSTLVAGLDLAAVGADHLLGQVPRHLLVVIDFGAERTPTVGQRAQVGRIAE